MKRIIFTFSFAIFVLLSYAQNMSFCEALPLLEKYAVSEFAEIRKEVDKSVTYPTTYFSGIQIKEALSSKITYNTGSYTYTADLGTYTAIEEARKKIREIGGLLIACYPGIKLTVYTDKIFKIEYHTLSFHSGEGFRLYDASMKIFPLGGKFYLSFDFNASEKKSFLTTNPSQAYTDYELITKSADNSVFSTAIRRVIAESKSGFKGIKADEIESPDYFSRFDVKYEVPGYNSYLEDRTLDIIHYVIPRLKVGSNDSFQQAVVSVKDMIESALGSDYGFVTSEDGSSIKYVNKYQPEKKVLTLFVTVENDNFELSLMISNQE